MKVLQPDGWVAPRGYANGIEARGRTVFIAGQIGWTKDQTFEAHDFCDQLEQALKNIVAVLDAAGAKPEHIVRMTWFLTDKCAYVENAKKIGQIYRSIMGKHFPTMTAVQVVALIEDAALIEIEATAVIPD